MSETIISRRKLRKIAKEVLRVGQKIFFHKKDLIDPEDMKNWEKSLLELDGTLRDKKSTDEELREQIEIVDEIASRHGGYFYHKKSWVENIEMFLVAAIVVIGVRSFFLQPFIIPTNSMFPSYYGMKPNIYEEGDDLPGLPQQTVNKLLLGAEHHRVQAESTGQLYVKGTIAIGQEGQPFFRADYTMERAYFPNGKFFVFPSNVRKYLLSIDGKDHEVRVSAEFDLDDVINEKFKNHGEVRQDKLDLGLYKLSEKNFEEGEVCLAFDVLLGDALFVDRFTYNFRTPAVGDPIVFQTGGIDEYNDKLKQAGLVSDRLGWNKIGEDKYYIKRLVGKAGDRLEIKPLDNGGNPPNGRARRSDPGYLLSNDKPIEGCYAFRENRKAAQYFEQNPGEERAPSGYPAYRAINLLRPGSRITVPPNSFFAMGDNSPDSSDGRMWGFVPEQKVVGRAFHVYYPFTKRWGFPPD